MLNIRLATLSDLPAITEIYNEAILTTTATFDTIPKSELEQKTWFLNHGTTHPVIVAEIDAQVIGWASLSHWSGRCAYDATAEISVYIREKSRGMGTGRKLMEALIPLGREAGLHTIISRIAGENDISVHLHESLGFKHVGVMKEVGKKFGRLLDVFLMQRMY